MAFPTIAARTEDFPGSVSSDTTTFTQTTGNLVIVYIATVVAKDVSADSGFTRLTPSGSALHHIFYKVLDGSEGGNVVLSWTTATRAVVLSWEITGASTTQAPEVSTEATGSSATPDPGTVTPTGGAKDYLWLAMFNQDGEEADDDTWCNSAPTDFGNLIQKSTGTGGAANTNCQSAGADFASNASSMNPGTFSTDQSLGWRAYTVAVHPGAVTGSFTATGGGVFNSSRQKGGRGTLAPVGGGVANLAKLHAGRLSLVPTGGGVLTSARRKGGQLAGVPTGGGIVNWSATSGSPEQHSGSFVATASGRALLGLRKGGRVSAPLTASGRALSAFSGAHRGSFSDTGGGIVTIAGFASSGTVVGGPPPVGRAEGSMPMGTGSLSGPVGRADRA